MTTSRRYDDDDDVLDDLDDLDYDISQKALLWSKIKENVRNSAVVVTQFDGSKLEEKKQTGNGSFLIEDLYIFSHRFS